MKKSLVFSSAALMMAALLVSCQINEFGDDIYIPEDGEIVFRLADASKVTKSSYASTKGVSIDLGSSNGTNFFLEETITRLDEILAPETKGTPAYSENFAALYGDFKAASYKTTGGTFESSAFDDGVFEKIGDNLWKRKYDDLKNNLPLYFFLRAPYSQEGTTIKNLAYNTSNGSISFSYDGSSLASAADQRDLLFTSRKVDTDEFSAFTKKGTAIPVLFHHALTGVKFAIGNDADDIKNNGIAITSVVFKGLYDIGNCLITPIKENNGYVDVPDIYSSASTTVWTASSLAASNTSKETGVSSGVYADTVYFESGPLADSFYEAGNKHNLNDDGATQTFWFIPQALARASSETPVTLTINYNFGGKTGLSWDLNLSDILSSIVWQAGELRTYTIRIDDVNLKIEDEVHMTSEQGYTSDTKNNIVITNTGNTDAFIRAAIVGQWLTEAGDPVFGFTDNVFNYYEVDSWYKDQFVLSASQGRKQGKFAGLAGYDQSTTYKNWFYNSVDGFYYYTKYVEPGKATGENGADTSGNLIHDPLFSTYTVGVAPDSQLGGLDVEIHFSLEISTQAISAKKSDGSRYTWKEAWTNALGYDPTVVPSN